MNQTNLSNQGSIVLVMRAVKEILLRLRLVKTLEHQTWTSIHGPVQAGATLLVIAKHMRTVLVAYLPVTSILIEVKILLIRRMVVVFLEHRINYKRA
ncbi:MAG: hypothetical protein CMF74_12730 [Maricaulis sp.]|nr:hypothetical protein [Maricaulis sp.]